MPKPDPDFFYHKELFSDDGFCPYQITGKCWLEGGTEIYFFYFRARHEEITIDLFLTEKDMQELENAIHFDALQFNNSYENQHRAGYITRQQAHHLLDFFILAFYREQYDKKQDNK